MSLVIRRGDDSIIPPERDGDGVLRYVHNAPNVHREMLYQIARDYQCIGNVMDMTFSEIRFWYDGLRAELRQTTKPLPKKSK
jgi:hypothetical protein